jgi:hypothetical protein
MSYKMARTLRSRLSQLLVGLFAILLAVPAAHAHVGSKDVFETVHAGPYTLFVTVRPPNVIPGVATVEVRSSGAAIQTLTITPLPLTGEASKHPPSSDPMTASAADPNFFTGSVWMMATGTWQVRFKIDGAGGEQVASVPVLAVPVAMLTMDRNLEIGLGLLGLFLVLSMAGIVAAAIGEARLKPGLTPTKANRTGGLIAMGASLVVMAGIVAACSHWWTVEASGYARNIFAPSPTTAELTGDQLDLRVTGPAEPYNGTGPRPKYRSNNDYLPDHDRLIHLYAIREPEMDAAFHLHPELVAPGDFRMNLPAMPPGHYQLYGDVVHRGGFPETLLASVDVPATLPGKPLGAEDASAMPAPLSAGDLGPAYKLPDGYTMVWAKPAALAPATGYLFQFTLLDPAGRPATDMQPYLGMAGHAAFVKTDGTVFAHTHPDGSAAMADMQLADESLGGGDRMAGMEMPAKIDPVVSFPYGFPSAGRYRIFVQMKHGETVETGVFDAEVK